MTDQPTDVDELAAQMVSAKEEMEAAKSALDAAKRAYAALETEMAQAMAASGQELVQSGERYVSVRTSKRWSIPKESRDAVAGLLKVHRPDMVKETVHTATLNKVASQMESEPEPWWSEVESLLSATSTTAVKVTKSKPRQKS